MSLNEGMNETFNERYIHAVADPGFCIRELVALCENIYFAKVADKNNEC